MRNLRQIGNYPAVQPFAGDYDSILFDNDKHLGFIEMNGHKPFAEIERVVV